MKDVLIIKQDEVSSTNDILKSLAEQYPDREVIVCAYRQTGGRGRNGRKFVSPEGGIYFSVLIHPQVSADKIHYCTAAMASAVCETIRDMTGRDAAIKWINDIYVKGKKVCGILTEGRFDEKGRLSYAIVGTGINVEEPAEGFPEEIKDKAGALYARGEAPEGLRDRLFEKVCENFLGYCENPEEKVWLPLYRKRSLVIGKRIEVIRDVTRPEEAYAAVAEAVTDDFGLVVTDGEGRREVLSTGEISIKVL